MTAEEVEPLLNGYFYFDVPEIKEVFAKDQLKQSLLIQSEFLAGNGKISGVPDLDTMVSSQIIEQL